jgi:hypothetical protein
MRGLVAAQAFEQCGEAADLVEAATRGLHVS